MKLILASTSIYRKQLLSQLGWPFEAIAPGVDENSVKQKITAPEVLAQELARLKARAVWTKFPDACVIGSDQVCSLGTQILNKPGSLEKATEQLQLMQGKTHRLFTGVTVLARDKEFSFINVATLRMRSLSPAQIAAYLNADKPFDCAGSYKLEAQGITLFEKIEVSDHTAIIGLPLIELTNVLLKLDLRLPEEKK